ncbi:FitA-like ribbon-helix-helix domain-containing protein [Clostridium perfringens]|uniref:FitA-like ribbon-helix-helix domain-containing protein n=1 Tax=Clostridium perfringens TaxID=1502 RepID=UPI0037551429
MADILIRDLSPEVITRLDALAKENGVSRNEFLKENLEKQTVLNEMKKFEADYKLTVDKILKVININTRVLRVISEELLIDIDSIFKEEF